MIDWGNWIFADSEWSNNCKKKRLKGTNFLQIKELKQWNNNNDRLKIIYIIIKVVPNNNN